MNIVHIGGSHVQDSCHTPAGSGVRGRGAPRRPSCPVAPRPANARLGAQASSAPRRRWLLAIAQDRAEERKLAATREQIAELETRAVEALKGGREDLAAKAAENIAALEGDAQAAEKARTIFSAEIAKLERHVRGQSTRLAELERGRRIARAAESVRVMRRGRLEDGALPSSDAFRSRNDARAAARAADASLRRRDRRSTRSTPSRRPKASTRRWPIGFRPAGQAARRRCARAAEGEGRHSGVIIPQTCQTRKI